MPQVSVIIPTYNRARYVVEAIDSVLRQTYADYEIIVVDDGSTDNTREVLQPYLDRIHYIFQPNAGVSAARNTGVRAASSEFIAFLDSDDKWLPRKLEVQIPLMDDERVVLSYTNLAVLDSKGERQKQIDSKIEDRQLIPAPLELIAVENHPWIHLGATVIRHDALRRVGMFNESIRVCEDNQIIFRLAFEGFFASTSEVLYELNRSEGFDRLTLVGNDQYTREVVAANIEMLMEAYIRASNYDLPQSLLLSLRKRLSIYLVKQALCFAKTGSYSSARRRGLESLLMGAKGGTALRAALAMLFPQLYAELSSRKNKICTV